MNYTTEVEVRRIYVPSPKDESTIPVTLRTLWLTRLDADQHCAEPQRLRVFARKRQGVMTFSMTCVKWLIQPWHTNPTGVAKTWYKEQVEYIQDQEGQTVMKWTKWTDNMDEGQVRTWLEARLGKDRTRQVMDELLADIGPAPKKDVASVLLAMSDDEIKRLIAARAALRRDT